MVTRLIVLGALCMALSGCPTVSGSFCAVQHPIRPSQQAIEAMSDADVAQILATNEKGAKLCGWKP